MLEKHLATAIAEKSRVEAELTETRGAAVASLKQHKQRRAAYVCPFDPSFVESKPNCA